MAIFHLAVKTRSRAKGQSATSAAAYRAGERIVDERTNEVHDYSRRSGVLHSEILTPKNAPDWAHDRSHLWNAAEQSETRKNSTVSREFEISLPAELTPKQRLELAQDFTRGLVEKHGFAADIALHNPGKGGDNRNFHAHILCTTRRLTPDGFGEKTRELDGRSSAIEEIREEWARKANAALENAGHDTRIDHRSLKVQMIEAQERGDHEAADKLQRVPTVHLGPTVVQMERKGVRTEIGDKAREITTTNAKIIDLKREREARIKEAGQIIREAREERQNDRAVRPRADRPAISNLREKSRDARGSRSQSGARNTRRISETTKPNIGSIGTNPPPISRGRLRHLSQLSMVRIEGRSEGILSRHVSGNLEQQRAERNPDVRRNGTDLTSAKREPMTYGRAKEIWTGCIDREQRQIIANLKKQTPRIAAEAKAAQIELAEHKQSKPEPPRGMFAFAKRGAYEAELNVWQEKHDVLLAGASKKLHTQKIVAQALRNPFETRTIAERRAAEKSPKVLAMYQDFQKRETARIVAERAATKTSKIVPIHTARKTPEREQSVPSQSAADRFRAKVEQERSLSARAAPQNTPTGQSAADRFRAQVTQERGTGRTPAEEKRERLRKAVELTKAMNREDNPQKKAEMKKEIDALLQSGRGQNRGRGR
ncbi:MobQ family relaxase [Acetobacter orientalis]|uniref:MobQ family relaxase n=1 Tax=Acetobacter orientalis TaxID=146474 RepID=UPI000A3A009A|nr:MobQ family relaxase [Acetobacter orientalis]